MEFPSKNNTVKKILLFFQKLALALGVIFFKIIGKTCHESGGL